jgi:hypothetical protein
MNWGFMFFLILSSSLIICSNNSADYKLLPGEFIDENGKYVGPTGIYNGKLYVIKTTKTEFESHGIVRSDSLSDTLVKKIRLLIKELNGDTAALRKAGIYKYVLEIEGSKDVRKQIIDIVNQDDGFYDSIPGNARGYILPENSREYGGMVDFKGEVIEVRPGCVADPCSDTLATIKMPSLRDAKYEFHSHPSGKRIIRLPGAKTKTCMFKQAPSEKDLYAAKSRLAYVFGMRDSIVYIYKNKKILATLPAKYFVSPDYSEKSGLAPN